MKETKNKNEVTTSNLLVGITGLMQLCNCGRKTAEDIANSSNAVVRIGRRKLYKVDKINEYLNTLCGQE